MKKVRHSDYVLIEKIQMLAALLRAGNQPAWASHLIKAIETRHSDAHLRRDILRFYNGMGSLNELTLHVDGNPEWKINKDFAMLRADIFALCHLQLAVAGEPAA